MEIKEILQELCENKISVEEAEKEIKNNQFESIDDYAKIDHNRKERAGTSEVVFCQGKKDEFLVNIYKSIYNEAGEVLGTRASKEQYELVKNAFSEMNSLEENSLQENSSKVDGLKTGNDGKNLKTSGMEVKYSEISRILKIEKNKEKIGNIAICTGGTADIPVAEEAAETAEFLGNYVERIYDVGVAGIHRILSQRDKLEKANCIIVIAGMEGALASVVGGMSKVPVIAVPTSVGYGANFGGLAALLSMINSCSNCISVVNIDNGYGAGYIASQINRLACGKK